MSRLGAIAGAVALFMALAAPAAAQTAAADESARVALIERVSQSVLHIRAEPKDPPPTVPPKSGRGDKPALQDFFDSLQSQRSPRKQEGSGFVVDQQRGLVLTAAHIAADAKSLAVGLADGSQHPAELVGIDEESGLALLRVAGLKPPALPLSTRSVRAGETAIVVGWMIPMKAVMPIEGMVMGSAPGVADSDLAPVFADYVALDAVLPNGGFGGAPVVDRSGQVIGMVSAIFGATYGPGALTLIIPAHGMAGLIEQLVAHGRVPRSQIGIALDCTPAPCRITDVDPGGPAEAAGLRTGDSLLAVDGAVAQTDSQVRRAIAAKPAGAAVALTIERDGRQSLLSAVTIARP